VNLKRAWLCLLVPYLVLTVLYYATAFEWKVSDGVAWETRENFFGFWLLYSAVFVFVLIVRGTVRFVEAFDRDAREMRERRRAEDLRRGVCPACGYDIRGLPRARCPECGENLITAKSAFEGGEGAANKGREEALRLAGLPSMNRQ